MVTMGSKILIYVQMDQVMQGSMRTYIRLFKNPKSEPPTLEIENFATITKPTNLHKPLTIVKIK